jgi:hypothetical protein
MHVPTKEGGAAASFYRLSFEKLYSFCRRAVLERWLSFLLSLANLVVVIPSSFWYDKILVSEVESWRGGRGGGRRE